MSEIATLNAARRVPTPVNEPIRSYAPGSAERAELKARLASMSNERVDIPLIIGGQEIRTGTTQQSVMPFERRGRSRIARRFSFEPRSCWPPRGEPPSILRRCSARPRPRFKPRSTRRAS
jgi:hypothetical protein